MTSRGRFASGHLSGRLREYRRVGRRINSHIGYTKTEHYISRTCLMCKKTEDIPIKRRKSKFCSLSCSTRYRNLNLSFLKKNMTMQEKK